MILPLSASDRDDDVQESDLARVDGMNAFAAATVLSETSFDHFLDMSPEVRREHFANLIGDSRVVSVPSRSECTH
jgi:hypothetical protein